MTLYDLAKNIVLQGNIDVQLYDGDDIVETKLFEQCGDFDAECLGELDEWEDYEVQYIYTTNLTKNYPKPNTVDGCMVIELKKPTE